MPRKLEIKKGDRYGQMLIESEVEQKGDKRRFLCLCDCGEQKIVGLNDLRTRRTRSCGCIRREKMTKHGDIGKALYRVWNNMKMRCLNPKAPNYSYYGGRGIEVSLEWHEYENFKRDMGAKYKQGLQLDRRDNEGPYSASNCQWVTHSENQRNRRNNKMITFNGKTRCVKEWSEITNIHSDTIRNRIKKGWSAEKTLTTAPRRSKK